MKRLQPDTKWGPLEVGLHPLIEAIGPRGEAVGADWHTDSRVICARYPIEASDGVEAMLAIDDLSVRLAAELAGMGPG